MTVNTKFITADQIWTDETTIYWFNLDGTDFGTEYVFDNDRYGIAETGDVSTVLDEDGSPLTDGDIETIAVRNSIKITDTLRMETSGC